MQQLSLRYCEEACESFQPDKYDYLEVMNFLVFYKPEEEQC